jgi:hypothetical protein
MNVVSTDHRDGAGRYEIQVKGHLTARWTAWFDGFTLALADNGTTVLTGFVVDQAALQGVLRTLADLGLPLLSVTSDASDATTTTRPTDAR